MDKLAIFYQAQKPPVIDGIIKPMKPNGYSDSGADMAYVLRQAGIEIITPISSPNPLHDLEWVFPDTIGGFEHASNLGATLFWLNTVLFKGHPVEEWMDKTVRFIGQSPDAVDKYDDKWLTNQELRAIRCPLPKAILIGTKADPNVIPIENALDDTFDFPTPCVIKPIRGRGSQGVSLVETKDELRQSLDDLFINGTSEYGDAMMLEEYLDGTEITLTIMPMGRYEIDGKTIIKDTYWALPAVRRFNHINGIAPYNGTVAVTENSIVLTDDELNHIDIQTVIRYCELAAKKVGAKAPIRIDCRANHTGKYFLFDLNMKPNITGAGRPNRDNQDSLSTMAARAIGWSYADFLKNIMEQAW